MECKFIRQGDIIICSLCGFRVQSEQSPDRVHRICTQNKVVEKPKEYPSFIKMATNAVKAGIDYVLSGFKNSKEEEVKRRLEICGGNEEKGIPVCPNFDNGRCIECGCYTALKARLDSGSCPIGKW